MAASAEGKDIDRRKWIRYTTSDIPKLENLKELYTLNKEYLNCRGESIYLAAIHAASAKGHIEVIKWLISEGANVNMRDGIDVTPLHYAALYGKLDIVQILLAKGAYLNAKDRLKQTALHFSSREGHPETVQYLLVEGAAREALNLDGETSRQVAKNNEVQKVFDLFRPSLVQICIQTLYQAHTDITQMFSLTQQQLDSLPQHLNRKLAPYITV